MAVAATVLVLILALIVCYGRFSARLRGYVLVLGTVTALTSAGSVGPIPTGGAAAAAPGGPTATTGTAGPLFRRFCQRCHGADGRGERDDSVPDFTRPAWQKRWSDAQLAAAILEGKGVAMPAFAGRLSKAQARALVAHLRAFAPRRPVANGAAAAVSPRTADFDAQFRQLQKEYEELRQRLKELTADEGGADKPRPRAALQPVGHGLTGAPRPAGTLFRQLCQRCHGASGEGAREKGDDVPDLRRREWHQHRSDAQLLASILKGTDGSMPAFRRQLSEAEARALVAHVRGFVAANPKAAPPAATMSKSASAGIR